MSEVRAKPLRNSAGDLMRVVVKCPGCGDRHVINLQPGDNGAGGKLPVWSFNGNFERPTVSPSLLVTVNSPDHPHYQPRAASSVCHSFIADGKIQFLADCTHPLAGQTVELPVWEKTDE